MNSFHPKAMIAWLVLWLKAEPVVASVLAADAVTVGAHFGIHLDTSNTLVLGAVATAIATWAARRQVTAGPTPPSTTDGGALYVAGPDGKVVISTSSVSTSSTAATAFAWGSPPGTAAAPSFVSQVIDEAVVDGKRLGRHVLHDARSLAFRAAELVDKTQPVVTQEWVFPGKPLDQGQLGSCTGNATAHLLRVHQSKVGKLNEAAARRIYSLATHLDAAPGVWPPTDTGSDGLSALKAAQQLGLFTGTYRWCFGLDDVLAVLSQHGPVIIGIPWYSGFDTPAQDGTVTISGKVRGGHEVCVIGVNAEAKTVQLVNSWGASWGAAGRFQMSWDALDHLLKQHGDAATIG